MKVCSRTPVPPQWEHIFAPTGITVPLGRTVLCATGCGATGAGTTTPWADATAAVNAVATTSIVVFVFMMNILPQTSNFR